MLKTHVLGASVEGRPLHVYELENDAPPILIIGGVHGDEPQSSFVANEVVELIHTKVGGMMDEHLIIIPKLNVDGLEHGTRKNANEVDLNRNFPTTNWKLSARDDPYFGGPTAGSEPETQVVLDVVRRYGPQRVLSIHCIDQDRFCINYDGPAQVLAEVMSKANNYPVNDDIGYETPGSLGSWLGFERKIPVITLELPAHMTGEDCWRENRDAIINLIQAPFN